jgi:hypothetical protein
MKKYFFILIMICLSVSLASADVDFPEFSIDGQNSYYFVHDDGGVKDLDPNAVPMSFDPENNYSIYYIYNDIDVNNDNTTTFNDATIDNSGSGDVHIGETNTNVGVSNYAGEDAGSGGVYGSAGGGSYGDTWFKTS